MPDSLRPEGAAGGRAPLPSVGSVLVSHTHTRLSTSTCSPPACTNKRKWVPASLPRARFLCKRFSNFRLSLPGLAVGGFRDHQGTFSSALPSTQLLHGRESQLVSKGRGGPAGLHVVGVHPQSASRRQCFCMTLPGAQGEEWIVWLPGRVSSIIAMGPGMGGSGGCGEFSEAAQSPWR